MGIPGPFEKDTSQIINDFVFQLGLPWYHVPTFQNCRQENIQSFLDQSFHCVNFPLDIDTIKSYPERLDLFFGMNDKYTLYPEHKKCVAEIRNLQVVLKANSSTINTTFESVEAFLQTSSLENVLKGRENVMNKSSDMREVYANLSHCYEACNWVNGNDLSTLRNIYRDNYIVTLIGSDQKKEYDILTEMPEILMNMKNYISDIAEDVRKTEEYLIGNMTKTQLFVTLYQPSFVYLKEKLFQQNNYLSQILLAKYVKLILSENKKFMDMYDYIFNFKFPLLNTGTVNNYALVKEALRLSDEFNQTKMGQLVGNLKIDLEENFLKLVQEFHEQRFLLPDQLQEQIVKNTERFLQTTTSIQRMLQDYQDKFQLDTDFFM